MLKLFIALLLVTTPTFADEDVCCVFSTASGESVQTFAWIVSSSNCKKGSSYQGKNVCASVPDPENTYCGSESTGQDRCGKCGFFWSGKECLTQNPKDVAKKELEEEMKKKDAKGTDASKPNSTPAPSQPSSSNPDDDQLFNSKDRSKNKGFDSGQ